MSKKHFQWAATHLGQWQRHLERMEDKTNAEIGAFTGAYQMCIDMFSQFNPRFDAERFREWVDRVSAEGESQ